MARLSKADIATTNATRITEKAWCAYCAEIATNHPGKFRRARFLVQGFPVCGSCARSTAAAWRAAGEYRAQLAVDRASTDPLVCTDKNCTNGWYYWNGSTYPCSTCQARRDWHRHKSAVTVLCEEGYPVDDNPDLLDVLNSTSPQMSAANAKMQARYQELLKN